VRRDLEEGKVPEGSRGREGPLTRRGETEQWGKGLDQSKGRGRPENREVEGGEDSPHCLKMESGNRE